MGIDELGQIQVTDVQCLDGGTSHNQITIFS